MCCRQQRPLWFRSAELPLAVFLSLESAQFLCRKCSMILKTDAATHCLTQPRLESRITKATEPGRTPPKDEAYGLLESLRTHPNHRVEAAPRHASSGSVSQCNKVE